MTGHGRLLPPRLRFRGSEWTPEALDATARAWWAELRGALPDPPPLVATVLPVHPEGVALFFALCALPGTAVVTLAEDPTAWRSDPALPVDAPIVLPPMSITGLPGQGPVRVGIPVADLTAGIFLAQGILVALLERERSGRGQWVHPSLLQAMITMLDFQAARWLIAGEIPPQAGNDHPTAIPTGVFKTKDGHINIAASGQNMFRRLCEALGTEPLLEDPRFKTAPDRSKHRKALAPELEKAFAKRTSAEWVELLNVKGVPSGPILDVKQVFENEQVKHLQMAVPVKHPALGEVFVQAPPVTLSRTPASVRRHSPDTGEHSDEILGELGFSQGEIRILRDEKVV